MCSYLVNKTFECLYTCPRIVLIRPDRISVPLSSLSEEAESLLQLKANDTLDLPMPSNSKRLLQVLGYIMLAITQATASIKRNQMQLGDYLAALEKDRQSLSEFLSKDLHDKRRQQGCPNSVFRT